MDKLRFNCRFNPNNTRHKKAWDILNRQPNGTRTEFVISAIIAYGDKNEHLKELIAQAVKDGLQNTHIQIEQPKDNGIPTEVMGFLNSL